MWIRILLISAALLAVVDPALASRVASRSIRGVSTGVMLEQAWTAAVQAGGKCLADSGRSTGGPAFSCVFDGSTLFVRKTNYMDAVQVTRIDYFFFPSKLGQSLSVFLKEQLGVDRVVTPDGGKLTSWQHLTSGEAVEAHCDGGISPGNISHPVRCDVTVTNERLMAADREMGARRHWLPVPLTSWMR